MSVQGMVETAVLDGITLSIEATDDGFDNALVKHEFPGTNGAELEPMGQHARTVQVRAWFIDDDYPNHIKLLEKLRTPNGHRAFQHPLYGLLYGDVERVSVHHDDTIQTAVVDITFVEDGIVSASPATLKIVTDAVTAASVQGATSRWAKLTAALSAAESKYRAVKQSVTAYENKLTAAAATCTNTLSALSNPAASFTSMLNLVSGLPATVITAAAQAAERYSVAYQTLKNTPATFIASLNTALRSFDNSFSASGSSNPAASEAAAIVQTVITLSCSEALANATADVLNQEQQLRDSAKNAEQASPVDSSGNFVPSADNSDETSSSDSTVVSNLMTNTDMERTLATARTYLQDAITAARNNGFNPQPYKDMALALEEHVNSIKLERENITQITLDQPMPLHLVCLRYGLPYRMAERLLTINDIPDPNRVSGTINIYQENA
jgi:prophage DNA circulation protein